MRALAEYAMRGRREAVVLAMGASAIPLFFWVGAAVVGLVTLRRGMRDGLVVMLGAMVPAAVFAAVTNEILPLAAVIGIVVCAGMLRLTASWPWTLCLAAMLGLTLSAGLHFGAGPLLEQMQQMIGAVFENAARQADPATAAQLQPPTRVQIAGAFGVMHSAMLMLSLVLARWWQSQLYNPGGLREEMHALRLSGAQVVGLLLLAGLLYRLGPEFQLWAWMPLAPLLVSGLGLVHAMYAGRGGRGWLGLFYAALFLLQPVKHLVVVLAAMDGWLDLRQRLLRRRGGDDDKG